MQEQPDSTEPTGDEMPVPFTHSGEGMPVKVFLLRQKLYRKAKREPRCRFYPRYDRIYRPDVLRTAGDRVAANDDAPGVDAVSIRTIRDAAQDVDGFIAELHLAWRCKNYRTQTVKRAYIPKANGKQRTWRRNR